GVEWGLVDEGVPGSKLEAAVIERAMQFAARSKRPADAKGIALTPLARKRSENGVEYSAVSVELDRARRLATITLRGPDAPPPKTADEMVGQGASFWPLRLARELDDAILDLRGNEVEVAAVGVKSSR